MFFFLVKQKTAYEMRISDWSSDVCSSDLVPLRRIRPGFRETAREAVPRAGRAPARRRAQRGRIQAAAPDERRLPATPCLYVAGRRALRHAVVASATQARPYCAQLRSRRRTLQHEAEQPVQMAKAGRERKRGE